MTTPKQRYKLKYIANMIKNRLCLNCGKPLDESETHKSCEACRIKQSDYGKQRRRELVAAGRCPQCNKSAQYGFTLCRKCRIITNAQKRLKFAIKMNKINAMKADAEIEGGQ